LIVVSIKGCHKELVRLETGKLMEVMGCIDAEDRDRVAEDSVHIVQYATVGVPCGGGGAVVEERERKEVDMTLNQLVAKMRDAMKAMREVGMWMKRPCLRMKETTTGIEQATSRID